MQTVSTYQNHESLFFPLSLCLYKALFYFIFYCTVVFEFYHHFLNYVSTNVLDISTILHETNNVALCPIATRCLAGLYRCRVAQAL